MKFSGSLLENKDIGSRIFINSLVKTKTLLKDVFGLLFEGSDPNIIKIDENTEKFSFDILFIMNGREISASFCYDVEDHGNDIVTEILTISEHYTDKIIIPGEEKEGKSNNNLYLENVKKIQDYLEKRYELNFTPLDLLEKDSNIISITPNDQELTWFTIFNQDHHEGTFEVKYQFTAGQDQYITLLQNIQHKIFLD